MDGGGPESIACSEREPWMFCRRSDIAWSCLCSELCVMSTIKALLQLMFVHTLSFIYIYFLFIYFFTVGAENHSDVEPCCVSSSAFLSISIFTLPDHVLSLPLFCTLHANPLCRPSLTFPLSFPRHSCSCKSFAWAPLSPALVVGSLT